MSPQKENNFYIDQPRAIQLGNVFLHLYKQMLKLELDWLVAVNTTYLYSFQSICINWFTCHRLNADNRYTSMCCEDSDNINQALFSGWIYKVKCNAVGWYTVSHTHLTILVYCIDTVCAKVRVIKCGRVNIFISLHRCCRSFISTRGYQVKVARAIICT